MRTSESEREDLLAEAHRFVRIRSSSDTAERSGPLLAEAHRRVAASGPEEPVRLLHHLACTGGTLFAKCLAAMPNALLLSEIDPLSDLHLPKDRQPFYPTDLIAGLRYDPRGPSERMITAVFHAALAQLRHEARDDGRHLILRDHAHSQFCTDADPDVRPTLYEIVSAVAPVRAVVTVRHPIDSYLSLRHHGWVAFSPDTLEEYCRRSLLFLDRHDDLERIQYEELTAAPMDTTKRLCEALELPWTAEFERLAPAFVLSGDSGRKGARISGRPRREVSKEILTEAKTSRSYAELCARLRYDAKIEP